MKDSAQARFPQRIGPYQVIQPLARGKMAEIFLARSIAEHGFEKLIAIKRILPEFALDQGAIDMFIDEANITASLNHTNIAQVFEFGEVDETFYLAMEYVHGINLREVSEFYTRQGLSLPFPLAVYCIKQVCAALEYAHTQVDSSGRSRGIIHRDICPSNIMLSFEGDVKLIDFGIVKATHQLHETKYATIKGKMEYMSPEQAAGAAVDQRTDIYSCGVTLYELITGVNPFASENISSTLDKLQQHQITSPAAVNADIPRELEAICMRALARAPAQRFASAAALEVALEDFVGGLGYGRRQVRLWIDANFPQQKNTTTLAFDQMVTEQLVVDCSRSPESASSLVQTEEDMPNPFSLREGPINKYDSIDDGITEPDTFPKKRPGGKSPGKS